MRNPQGYIIITEPDKPPVEYDTFTCGHCGCVVTVKPKEDPATLGGFCRQCMKLTCPKCNEKAVCLPLLKQIEASENADYHRRQRGY